MPTIKRFPNCRIEIRTRDHLPPHFHVVASDGRDVLVEIETLAMRGRIDPEEIVSVLDWARDNRDALMEEWRKWHP